MHSSAISIKEVYYKPNSEHIRLMVMSQNKSNVRRIGKVKKKDEALLGGKMLNVQDPFTGLYVSNGGSSAVIEPPYDPLVLETVCEQNNTLLQAITIMEVNIDGTGYGIVKKDINGSEVEAEKVKLSSFLETPYPNTSFVAIRRAIRKDVERVGYGFLEILRNMQGEIVLMRPLRAAYTRLLMLDDPVLVTKPIVRDGVASNVTYWDSERRFVQIIGGKTRYMREFGSSRKINAETGSWISKDDMVDATKEGTEVLYFTAETNSKSPYGIPRWINKLPSALGSRKAEEHNLEFFDAGGMPPAIIFVTGGRMSETSSQALDGILSGKAYRGTKHRGALVEIESSSTSLDSEGKVDVKVERFGDTNKDAMFASYDKQAAEHIRSAFRMPAIFFGNSGDYNFATAYTAVMLAEAQVFSPERDEFDNIFNQTITAALGITSYIMKSKPIALSNVDSQMKGLELVKTIIEPESVVETVNTLTGLSLKYKVGSELQVTTATTGGVSSTPQEGTNPLDNAAPAPNNSSASQTGKVTKADADDLVGLAYAHTYYLGLSKKNDYVTLPENEVAKQVKSLCKVNRKKFDELTAKIVLGSASEDAQALLAHSCALMGCEHDH